MAKKHEAIYGDLGATARQAVKRAEPTAPMSGNRLLGRMNALAELTSGEIVDKRQRLVDPVRCRMWARHNRRYDLLNEQNCADLIEGFKVQGRQEFPAIVRALHDDPEHDYEVICGARRHWTVSWLRAHNYPQFKFLIEIRELTDEEAFRLSDIENRDKADISDYERALDYADALERYYEGKQKAMAERLEVSESWLSRFLALAKLPKAIVEAYGNPTEIRVKHLRTINPLLADPKRRTQILESARQLADDQRAAKARGEPTLPGVQVLARLGAGAMKPKRPKALGTFSADGARVVASRSGKHVVLKVAPAAPLETVLALCREALEKHYREDA